MTRWQGFPFNLCFTFNIILSSANISFTMVAQRCELIVCWKKLLKMSPLTHYWCFHQSILSLWPKKLASFLLREENAKARAMPCLLTIIERRGTYMTSWLLINSSQPKSLGLTGCRHCLLKDSMARGKQRQWVIDSFSFHQCLPSWPKMGLPFFLCAVMGKILLHIELSIGAEI